MVHFFIACEIIRRDQIIVAILKSLQQHIAMPLLAILPVSLIFSHTLARLSKCWRDRELQLFGAATTISM